MLEISYSTILVEGQSDVHRVIAMRAYPFRFFRFPAPRNPKDYDRLKIMRDIEQRASVAWGSGKNATAATDFLRIYIPYHPREDTVNSGPGFEVVQAPSYESGTRLSQPSSSHKPSTDANRPDIRQSRRTDMSHSNTNQKKRKR